MSTTATTSAVPKLIQGEDIVLMIDNKTTLHAKSHNLSVELEMKEYQTKDSGGKRVYPGVVSWSADGDGLVVVDTSITGATASSGVLDLTLNKTRVAVVVKANIEGAFGEYEGHAYVTSFSLSSEAGSDATYSYKLTGDGTLTPVAEEEDDDDQPSDDQSNDQPSDPQ